MWPASLGELLVQGVHALGIRFSEGKEMFRRRIQAKMPQKGDTVRIQAGSGTTEMRYEGIVTDIGNGLICINATEAFRTQDGKTYLEEGDDQIEVCIGTGFITMLRWLTPT